MQYRHPPLSKTCGEVCKNAAVRPDEAALQCRRLFFLVCRRIRSDLTCMHKIMYGLLDIPCDAVFAAPTRFGLRDHTLKIYQQRCKTRRLQHAFSVRVVPYWNSLPEEISNASSVELFKSQLSGTPCSLKFPSNLSPDISSQTRSTLTYHTLVSCL